MNDRDITGTNWSDSEIDIIVADYFEMLQHQFSGVEISKADRNRNLQTLLRRSRGSIGYKHQNISAVLLKLGLPWVSGFKPMANYQKALIDGIERYLDASGDMFLRESFNSPVKADELIFEPSPVLLEDASEYAPLQRLARKFDPALRDERNRKLGKLGEERVFHREMQNLALHGRPDLARRVRWTSQEDGDGVGYDIHSFTTNGADRLLEVKTTIGHSTTPFYISRNEKAVSDERSNDYRIVRVYDFARRPRAFELAPPFEDCITLRPYIYEASFHRSR